MQKICCGFVLECDKERENYWEHFPRKCHSSINKCGGETLNKKRLMMYHLKSCYKFSLKSDSQVIKTLPKKTSPPLLLETLADLQDFFTHAATAESRRLHDHVVSRPLTSQSQTSQYAHHTAATTDQSDSPQLEFSLCYDAQRGVLQVHLLLISGLVSPKCRVKAILGDKMYTSELAAQGCENTLVFDEVLEFSQIYLLEVTKFTLYLQIYTYNASYVPLFIGSVLLPLENVDIYGGSCFARTIDKNCQQIMEIIQETSRGEVEIQLTLSTDQKTIKGTLLQANNLCKMDFLGSSDPFVKVHLFWKEKRLAKWNTSVKKKSLNPVYNESFSFNTDCKDVNELYVMLTVKDYDTIGKNDVIGYALIGEASSCKSGRNQWAAMIKKLGEATTFKHTLSL